MRKNEILQALEVLIKHKLLLRVSDLDIYHGRFSDGKTDKEWQVDPSFSNASNSTGNHNVNKINALSAGDYQIAKEFAEARIGLERWNRRVSGRSGGENLKPEVHKIVSQDEHAVIFNYKFKYKSLSEEAKKEVEKALTVMCQFSVTGLVPVKFEERDLFSIVRDKILSYKSHTGKTFLKEEDIDIIYDNVTKVNPKISKEMVRNIICAMNTRKMLMVQDLSKTIIAEYVGKGGYYTPTKFECAGYPLSEEYLSAWLANNHIIGLVRDVDSATLDKRIEAYSLFDLEKINTEKAIGEKYQKIIAQFGAISELVNSFDIDEDVKKFFEVATPSEAIAKISENEKYKDLYNLDTGVWEGFSVGEHTETTLRIFEETYEESVPKEIIPFVKIALLGHDIGKGVKENLSQKEKNRKYAGEFFDDLKLPENMKNILLYVIGDSQSYTSAYYVNKNINAITSLKLELDRLLEKELGREPTRQEVEGLLEVCKIIQTCDSGAYTRYGVTKDNKRKVFYYNGNDSFTSSFEKPTGLTKRKIKMKVPEQGEE